VTVTGVQLAYLLSGVVVVEIVFSWPGLGPARAAGGRGPRLPGAAGRDPAVRLVFLVINLVVDLLYSRIDPRIRR
jgi:peptide/nickel transport system permease protein